MCCKNMQNHRNNNCSCSVFVLIIDSCSCFVLEPSDLCEPYETTHYLRFNVWVSNMECHWIPIIIIRNSDILHKNTNMNGRYCKWKKLFWERWKLQENKPFSWLRNCLYDRRDGWNSKLALPELVIIKLLWITIEESLISC